MDAIEIVKKLSNHYLIEHEVSLQMQLGLPYLEKKNETLLLSFAPHHEVYENGTFNFYSPQYKIVFAYPFDHVVYFENLSYSGNTPVFVASVSDTKMLCTGQRLIKDLYWLCSRILSLWETAGTASDLIVLKYQQQYEETVRQLKLQDVYLKK